MKLRCLIACKTTFQIAERHILRNLNREVTRSKYKEWGVTVTTRATPTIYTPEAHTKTKLPHTVRSQDSIRLFAGRTPSFIISFRIE